MKAVAYKSYAIMCADDDCPWGDSTPAPNYRYAVREAQKHANETRHVCWVDSTSHRPLRPRGPK